jgi:hypothetical protein
VSCIDDSNYELTDTTDDHSSGEEHSATAILGDDSTVDNNHDHSNGSQYAGVHERRTNFGHREEICSVRCGLSVTSQNEIRKSFRTDHIHCTRASLETHGTNSKECAAAVNGVAPDVDNLRVNCKKFLCIDSSLHLSEFVIHKLGKGPQPVEGFTCFLLVVHLQEPSR